MRNLIRRVLLFFAASAFSLSAGAQATPVFNCSAGFSTTLTNACGIGIGGINGPGTFEVAGTPNGTLSNWEGTQMLLAQPNADHTALNIDYLHAAVNVQAFTTTYTYIPNGWNTSLTLSNNSNVNASGPGSQFTSGAGCEQSIFQSFPSPPPPPYPNQTFALTLDQHSPLIDANGTGQGGGSQLVNNFTYSGTQIFQSGADPCNPRDGTELYFYFTKRISTSPVPLVPVSTFTGSSSGTTLTVTGTPTGAPVVVGMF